MKEFKCKYCGKIFSSKHKLAGHTTHCKLNPNYDINREKCKQNISKSNKNNLNKNNKNNEIRNDLFCQYCNKQCKSLNSLHNHERLCKFNPNRVKSSFVKHNKINKNDNYVWNKGLTKFSDDRVNKQSNTLKNKYKTGELVSPNKGRKYTESEKKHLSEVRKKYLMEHPEKVPYLINHHSKVSYPEKYFKELFESDDFFKDIKTEYRVGLYSLDFAIPELLIDIEIDGEQHYVDSKIIQHDQIRSNNLEQLGWFIYRIRWSKYSKLNKIEKQEVINGLKNNINLIKMSRDMGIVAPIGRAGA